MQEDPAIIAREALAQDALAILRLWQRFMREEPDAVPDADPQAALQRWRERLSLQLLRRQVVVLARGPDLVGFAAFIDSQDREWVPAAVAYVVDLYVAFEARTTSAARQLYGILARRAAEEYACIWTNTSTRDHRMQVLLRRVGFRPLTGFVIPGLHDQLYFTIDLAAQAER